MSRQTPSGFCQAAPAPTSRTRCLALDIIIFSHPSQPVPRCNYCVSLHPAHLSTEPSNPHPRWWSQTPSPLWSPDSCLSSYKLHVFEGETSGTLHLATIHRGVSALRPPWSPEVKRNACCLTRSGCLGTCISFFKKINNLFVGLLLL